MPHDTLTLADVALRLEFAGDTGALTGLTAVETGWKVLDRPHLGLSFKLIVPSGRRRNNPVDGEKQTLQSATRGADGRSLTFVWDGLESLHGGRLDIRVELTVRLEDGRATWSCQLQNRSPLVIEAAYVPYLGGLRPPPGAKRLMLERPDYSDLHGGELWPHMEHVQGYFGTDYPTVHFGSHNGNLPMCGYMTVAAENQGLYIGYESEACEYVFPQAEARPGYGRSIDRSLVPHDTIDQHENQLRFAMIHLPYVQPNEARELPALSVKPYRGTWHAAADIFKQSSARLPTASLPAWLKEPHAWLQIHVNSPEGEARTRYRDLVPLARQMARHGITGMQITGWNYGGQDQGNPSHDTDPLLGTREEFREAIRQVQNLGVKVILFAKFTWADRATDRFRTDLIRLAVKDPYGDYYMHSGYRYQTPMQLQDINTKRLIPMCFLAEEYLGICEAEFRKMLDLGADGILFDECLHHGPAALCFDTSHGHRVGACVYANDNALIERFRKMSDPVRPDFCYAGEAIYDREAAVYHVNYFRTENPRHRPVHRFLRPDAAICTAVTGFDDREMVAQCLLYRYVISHEPFNFKGRPEDYPSTLEYAKQMDALRTELRKWFWDGECRDVLGATVSAADGAPHHPYSVFVPRDGSAPGVAIANDAVERNISVMLDVPGHDNGRYRYRLIDDPQWRSCAGGIAVPARSAAVVVPA